MISELLTFGGIIPIWVLPYFIIGAFIAEIFLANTDEGLGARITLAILWPLIVLITIGCWFVWKIRGG
ncbi:MAG: hypothetical protein V3U02_02310 [Calditrichia bacterium]